MCENDKRVTGTLTEKELSGQGLAVECTSLEPVAGGEAEGDREGAAPPPPSLALKLRTGDPPREGLGSRGRAVKLKLRCEESLSVLHACSHDTKYNNNFAINDDNNN